MQAYFDPEQAFSISIPQPVFEFSIGYKKKHVSYLIFYLFNPDNKTLCNHNIQSCAHYRTNYDSVLFLKLCIRSCFNPLMPGGNKKVTDT